MQCAEFSVGALGSVRYSEHEEDAYQSPESDLDDNDDDESLCEHPCSSTIY